MSLPPDPDEPVEYDSPPPARVAARAQVSCAQAYRALLEGSTGEPEAQAAHARCVAWCEHVDLRRECEPHEWTRLTTPLGRLPRQDRIDAGWLTEAAVCLAWALGQVEMPDYEEEADGAEVADAMHFLDDDAEKFRARLETRSRGECEDLLGTYLAIHWRLREFSLRPGRVDLVQFVQQCTWANMPLDDVRLIDDDLSLGGVPIVAASADLRERCRSRAMERHRAAEWLLGQHPIYSKVATDT